MTEIRLLLVRCLLCAGVCAGLLAPTSARAQTVLSQNFDNVPAIFTGGAPWVQVNRSSPAGAGVWHQGATGFNAHAGAANSCISNDFSAGSGLNCTISSWLITPVVTLQNGQTLQFYTRTRSFIDAPDRMQVRMSLAGTSTDVGTTATSVGVFTTLLLDINPTYSFSPWPTGYPTSWTAITITLSGIATPTAGRLAFRYFVEGGGPSGLNSDIVAIDTLTLSGTPANNCLIPLPACSGDLAPAGGNNAVDVNDLLAVISTWGAIGPPRPAGDASPLPLGDCTVNVNDLLAVVTTWGTCPGPTGACCLGDGVCAPGQTPTSCLALEGIYQGNNTLCGGVACPLPNNDSCPTATPLAVGASTGENLETATLDFAIPCNGVAVARGRWHKVTGNGNTLTASICASSGTFDGRLSVYCGISCNHLWCVSASDSNNCSVNKESVTWCSRAGQVYWILVHAATINPGQGLYTLQVTNGSSCTGAAFCSPPNDDCTDALPIGNGLTSFSTIGATTDGLPVAAGACNDGGATQTVADIWFRYTASCTGTLRVTTCSQLGGSTDYDSDIVIYSVAPCPPPDSSRIGCNDDDPVNPCGSGPPFASTAFAPVTAGLQYLIRIGGFSDKKVDYGTGVLNVTCSP